MGFVKRPQQLWWRKALFQVHLWAGIILGLYVIVVSMSGSAIVFRWEIEEWGSPKPNAEGRPLDFHALGKVAEETHPGYRFTGFLKPSDPHRAVKVFMRGGDDGIARLLDPVSGEDLGESPLAPALDWLTSLHVDLLAGNTGFIVNGAGAVSLIVMTLTGLVLWWPGIANWRRSLGVNFRLSWKRINWDLHSAAGFWTLVLILIWSVTGVYFVFPEPSMAALNKLVTVQPPREEPPAPPLLEGKEPLLIDDLIAFAAAATPGAATTWVDMPIDSGQAMIIRHEIYEPYANHHPRVYVDVYSGKVLHMDIALTGNTGDTVQRWISYLHYGNFGGSFVKVLWVILGLAPAVLAVTGGLMYWNRSLSKKLRRGTPA